MQSKKKAAQPYPPLATIYAAALLREKDFEVKLWDSMFRKSAEEVLTAIKEFTPDFFVVYDDGFNYLTKMCLTNMRNAALEMCKAAKQLGCTVIVSSSDATDHTAMYLNEGADYVIIGEAEHTLLELINKNETEKINGIALKKNNTVVKTAGRSVLKNLDELPMPAWDLVEIEKYKSVWLSNHGYFSINVATTRGCPFKCNWCAKPIYGNRYNSRSPQKVVNEIKYLQEHFAIDHIWFCDDIFGLKPFWVAEFAQLVLLEDMQLNYKIQSRADLLLQEDYVKNLALSGCSNVWMGAESGSQKILDAMDKGITIEQIAAATALLKQYKIHPSFFLQFGYLGETKEDILKTIEMVNKLKPHSIGISVSYPLQGTVFYEKVKNDLQQKANWKHSDDLDMMFKNTYQPSFYKTLHSFVHKNFQFQNAVASVKKSGKRDFSVKSKYIKNLLKLGYYYLSSAYLKYQLGL